MSAISAIDIALWDIAGKRVGLPVHQLLGGLTVKRLRSMPTIGFCEAPGKPEEYAELAAEVKARGFTACKMDPFAHTSYWYGEDLSTDLGLTEKQKRIGNREIGRCTKRRRPDFPIVVETHAMLNGPTAVEMANRIAAAGINCMWYEEPAGPEFPDEIATIRQKISLPVCVGERIHSRFMARPILEKHATDILMPDITRCGGIGEMKKIATMCEAFNVQSLRITSTGPYRTIAAVHVMATIPNFFRQEFMVHRRSLAG